MKEQRVKEKTLETSKKSIKGIMKKWYSLKQEAIDELKEGKKRKDH